jgi:hypothetical protein
VQARLGQRWRTIAQPATSSTGGYTATHRPAAPGTQDYRAVWLGDTDHGAALSPIVHVTVR